MLAVILSLLSLFNFQQDTAREQQQRADTVKLLQKNPALNDTGRYITINRVFVIGNRLTRDRIILRELSLKPGDVVYTADLPGIFDLDKKKLINLRLFNTVEIKTLELTPDRADLVVDVNERWYTFPAPLFELSDRNFNEWWQNYDHDFRRVNYGLRLYQFNMRGRNETLRFHLQFGFQRRFELLYRIPNIDREQKQGLTFEFQYWETKNLAFQTVDHKYDFLKADRLVRTIRYGSITYSYRNSFYKTHSVEAEFNKINIDDTVKLLNPIYLKGEKTSQQYFSLTYQFNSDHRDYFSYPLKGHQFLISVTKSGLFKNDELDRFEANLTYSRYFDLNKGFYFSNNFVGFWSTPDDLSYVNFGVLGFKKQFVRGYELYVIEGPYYLLNKATFKKQIFSRNYHWGKMPIRQFRHIPISVYLKTYADLGYVKNYPDYESLNVNTQLADKLLSGVGGGIDIIGAYDVVLRFEYTFNAEGQRGFFFHVKREF
jgi:outer membrane protein assembly factor BamA